MPCPWLIHYLTWSRVSWSIFLNVLSSKMTHLFLKNTTQYHDISLLKLKSKTSEVTGNSHKILTCSSCICVQYLGTREHKITLRKWLCGRVNQSQRWRMVTQVAGPAPGWDPASFSGDQFKVCQVQRLPVSDSVAYTLSTPCSLHFPFVGCLYIFSYLHKVISHKVKHNWLYFRLLNMSHFSPALPRLYPGHSVGVLSAHKTL